MRRLARGRSEATPARAMGLVATIVFTAVAVVTAAALLIWILI